jgi:hypothetical protein
METSYPGKFWDVDAPGGSIIRRSARMGVTQIDVKFRTHTSALEWGAQWLDVEIIKPDDYAKWLRDVEEWERTK